MANRRKILKGIGGGALAAAVPGLLPGLARGAESFLPEGLPSGVYENAKLDVLPGKKPLIKLTYRPPNYETPVSYFENAVTPNDAFFVRYHLSLIPEPADLREWRLQVGGESVATPLQLSIQDLQKLPQTELQAVCQCSGNRRGFSEPHVAGVQWGNGAMGNATWSGVRLKDILVKAGIKSDAVEVVVEGEDGPIVDKTPDFVKSIPVWKAMDENTLIAFKMNDQPLPPYNGFPARLVVPGWTATYWMKHLTGIRAVNKPFDGFWMKGAYRVPRGKFPVARPFETQLTEANEPITDIVVNSVIAAPGNGEKIRVGRPVDVKGVAWDAGSGIKRVEVSNDGGKSWHDAALGKDGGRFGFRPWSFRFTPSAAGSYAVLARATAVNGQTQATSLIFNPAGYHNNVPRPVTLVAA